MTPKQAIEKAAAFIKRIAYDKKLHYAAGLLIAGVLTNFYTRAFRRGYSHIGRSGKGSLRPRNQERNAGTCRLPMDDRRGFNVASSLLRG